jgi:tRNA threonylcarbamoyladenosine biosynthesis protein TsaB
MNNFILGIESSTNIALIYLLKNGELIDNFYSEEKNKHDELLAQNISEILTKNKLKVSDIDAIACSAGPGSFTGLRVGASLAKGLAFVNDIKIIPISFFELTLSLVNDFANSAIILPSHGDIYYYSEAKNYKNNNTIYLKKKSEIIEENIEIFGISNHQDLNIVNNNNPINLENIIKIALNKFKLNEFILAEEFVPNYHQEFQVKKSKK